MSTTLASSATRAKANHLPALSIAAVLGAICVLMLWLYNGPFINDRVVTNGAVIGRIVQVEQSWPSQKEEVRLLLSNVLPQEGFMYVTVPPQFATEARQYLQNRAEVMVRYRKPAYYWRFESQRGTIATSIEAFKH